MQTGVEKQVKMIIAGVGGQGVVYITNLLVESCLAADIPVATSEIHGLSQRGGSVTSALTFGEHVYGFVEPGGARFMLGFEALEAQRCLRYLNHESQVVIDSNRILPYAVNAGAAQYPDPAPMLEFLRNQIKRVVWVEDIDPRVDTIYRNMYVLGTASLFPGFPIPAHYIEKMISERPGRVAEKNLEVFKLARINESKNMEIYG